jgi:hypothetical protein
MACHTTEKSAFLQIIKMGHGRRVKIYEASGTISAFVLDVGESRDNFILTTYRQDPKNIAPLCLYEKHMTDFKMLRHSYS